MAHQKRFKIQAENGEFKVSDTVTGNFVLPDCGRDLYDFHSYLAHTGDDEYGQVVLESVLEGKRPITSMINQFQNVMA